MWVGSLRLFEMASRVLAHLASLTVSSVFAVMEMLRPPVVPVLPFLEGVAEKTAYPKEDPFLFPHGTPV